MLQENLEARGTPKKIPLLKQVQSFSTQPFYQKGFNAGKEDEQEEQETIIPSSGPFDNLPLK